MLRNFVEETKKNTDQIETDANNETEVEELQNVIVNVEKMRKDIFRIARTILDVCAKEEYNSREKIFYAMVDVANRLLEYKIGGKLRSINTMKSPKLFGCGVTLSDVPEKFTAALYSAIEIGKALEDAEMARTVDDIIKTFDLKNPSLTPKGSCFRQFDLKLQRELDEMFPCPMRQYR